MQHGMIWIGLGEMPMQPNGVNRLGSFSGAMNALLPVSLSARDRTLPWNLGFEVTQPRPERALVQAHFGDADGAPFAGLGEHAAVLAIDGGEHPVARHVFVRAADQTDLVLACAGAGLLGFAAPHGPREKFVTMPSRKQALGF